ncbi:MAG TPA: aminotransferase class V-fold PLP-dependent enzyme [Streptosporangiaceae bacterium]|jgi:pyridoxal 5-phosphate dependent beta-lyase|nr:aminotransferase class V-fold PLP-dependent enzyme [Streptosporangiaceae bacterium]
MPETQVSTQQTTDTLDEPWRQWHAQRHPAQTLHLDTAAAGRGSSATLRATAGHAKREAECGAYVAEAAAQPVLEAARADLAGMFGVPPAGVAFVESATAALQALLAAWPLRPGDRVAVLPSEWGPNLAAFEHAYLRLTELPSHPDGIIDLPGTERLLAAEPPAFVHVTHVASHRPLVQPVREIAAICRAAGVPLWVDAAQAVGHVDTATGADAQYAPSRKWLTGPRGVGLLAVADRWWDRLQIHTSPMELAALPGAPPVRYLQSFEANVPGRVGLATAVREYLETGPEQVWARLAEVGTLTRETLRDLPGWAVVEPAGAPSAITALRPTAGQDIAATRTRLIEDHGIITTASRVERAPRDMTEPLLRISPHVDCTPGALARLGDALALA